MKRFAYDALLVHVLMLYYELFKATTIFITHCEKVNWCLGVVFRPARSSFAAVYNCVDSRFGRETGEDVAFFIRPCCK
jgi:hypothetical protein